MRTGQFSAFLHQDTGHISVIKFPDDVEYQNQPHYINLHSGVAKKDLLQAIETYFDDNFIPDDQRIISCN